MWWNSWTTNKYQLILALLISRCPGLLTPAFGSLVRSLLEAPQHFSISPYSATDRLCALGHTVPLSGPSVLHPHVGALAPSYEELILGQAPGQTLSRGRLLQSPQHHHEGRTVNTPILWGNHTQKTEAQLAHWSPWNRGFGSLFWERPVWASLLHPWIRKLL